MLYCLPRWVHFVCQHFLSKHGQQPVQPQPVALRPLQQAQRPQPGQRPVAPARVVVRQQGQQQPPRERLAVHQTGRPGQQPPRVGVRGAVGRPQPVEADGEGAGHVQFVIGEGVGPGLGVVGQQAAQQVGLGQLGQIAGHR